MLRAPEASESSWTERPIGAVCVIARQRARHLLNVVNRVDLEEYLYGVVPAEMGPRRFDAIEGLKAQAVAARTYAMAHKRPVRERRVTTSVPTSEVPGLRRGSQWKIRSRPRRSRATRGLVLAYQVAVIADALFVSTCGGRDRKRGKRVLRRTAAVSYLVSVAVRRASVPTRASTERPVGSG